MEIKSTANENQNKDDFELKLNPCSVWPPVCGQVCVSGGFITRPSIRLMRILIQFIFQFLINLQDTSVNVFKDMYRILMMPANVRPGKVILHFSLLINLM